MRRRTLIAKSLAYSSGLLSLKACGGGSSNVGENIGVSTLPPATNQWQQNLNEIVEAIETRHVQPWSLMSKATFLSRAEMLRSKLLLATDAQAAAGLMQLVAGLADGHTRVFAWPYLKWLPVNMAVFKDGVFITQVAPAYQQLLRSQVLRVGGVDIGSALERVSNYWPAENVNAALNWGEFLLPCHSLLLDTGLAAGSEAEIELRLPNSSTVQTLKLPANFSGRVPYSVTTDTVPRDLRSPELPFWFEWLASSSVMYLRYKSCSGAAEFAALAGNMLRQMQGFNARRLVVDVRGNEGGDSAVIQPLISNLRSGGAINRPGSLVVITNRQTFSAAVDATLDLLELGATQIGEAPGQKPNFFGNVQTFSTSRTGVQLTYATRVSKRVAGDPLLLQPNQIVLRSAADYFAGRDPALELAVA